jgi:preprotein translocase subunit SecF
MELIPANTKIDFVSAMRPATLFSAVLMALSVTGWLIFGFNLGIDFRGGTQLQVVAPESAGLVDEARIRAGMARAGFDDAEVTRLGDVSQREFLVNLLTSEEDSAQQKADLSGEEKPAARVAGDDPSAAKPDVAASPDDPAPAAEAAAPADAAKPEEARSDAAGAAGSLAADAAAAADDADNPLAGLVGRIQKGLTEELGAPVQFNSIESIGPRVGQEITRSAIEAIVLTSVLILLYIWLRFDLRYAPGAVAALFHDIIVVGGVFAWLQIEFDQQIVAAMLVILGYSINDTVVIFDRIRENVELRGKVMLADVVNESLNQTLSRTLLTTSFTLVVVIALLVFGGPVLRGFALALFVGMISGVYSTVYVASAMLIWLESRVTARAPKVA